MLQKGTVLDLGGSQASFFMQAFTLTRRSFVNMSRDFGYYWLRLVIYVVVTICIGTIYLNVGTGYNSILVFDLLFFFTHSMFVCLKDTVNNGSSGELNKENPQCLRSLSRLRVGTNFQQRKEDTVKNQELPIV